MNVNIDTLVGKKFIRRGNKRKDVETVIDKLTTKNLAGEVIKTRYVCSHVFMGQTILNKDTLETTIKMSMI